MTAAGCGKSGGAKASGADVLRIIHTQNLAILDPIWSTSPGSKDYGFMTFDQLLAVDANYAPQPQMAEGWTVEDDGKTYVFKLREGLKFHDETVVRRNALAALQAHAAPAFDSQRVLLFSEERIYDGFEAYANQAISNMRYNGYTEADVLNPAVRSRLVEVLGECGRFDQYFRMNLFA